MITFLILKYSEIISEVLFSLKSLIVTLTIICWSLQTFFAEVLLLESELWEYHIDLLGIRKGLVDVGSKFV